MSCLKTFLIILHVVGLYFCYGQSRQFGHYGLPEGLPQETILCIDNDANGFLWLGTSDGTVRYDGTNFYIPPVDQETGLDLSGWRVGALLVDENMVYSGTGQKGVLIYDTFKNTTTAIGLPNSNCSALAKGPKGIFIGYYNQGIGYIDSFGNFKHLHFGDTIIKNTVSMTPFENYMYLGTDKGELYRFSSEHINEEKEIFIEKINTFNTAINRLLIRNNELLIATNEGLFRFDDTRVLPIKISKNEVQNTPFAVIDVVETETNTFIATSQGLLEGIWLSNNHFTCTSHHTASVKYDSFSLNSDGINDLHLHQDVVSIGHISLDLTTITKKQVFTDVISKYNLGNPSVFAVLETEGKLWIGTTSGVLVIDKNSSKHTLFPDIQSRSIIDDKKGNIWIGTGKGMILFSKADFTFNTQKKTKINSITTKKAQLENPNIRSIYKDLNDQLWVVTYNKGIYKFIGNVSKADFTFEGIITEENIAHIPSPFAINMHQDFDDNYWITTQKGLSKMKFDTSGKTIIKNYYEEDGLATSGVLSTYIDHKGILWVATRKGLSEYNVTTDSFTSYKKRNGLLNAFVYNILEDNDYNLWLSTNGGLFLFDRQLKTFANYTPKDGVQSTEFNLGAAHKNKDGALYFGGIAGLNKFNPRDVALLDRESPITFTQFKSNQNQIENTNSKTTSLKLPYNGFPLNISFAAMDYRPSKNITYQYRLSSENQQWNSLGDKNEVQFLSLPHGTHIVEIQGVSRGKAWNQNPLSLQLTVTPPWYQSNLAYFGYLLLFLTGIFIYYKIALQRKLAGQEAKRLQDLDDLKSRFITNITHEFRTPLTIILGYVDNLKSKLTVPSAASKDLDTIEKNSANLLGLVNQMLDLAKLEQGRLEIRYKKNDISGFINHITQSFRSLAEDKKVALTFTSEMLDPMVDFDAEKLRQICTNLISNAIKFTEEKGVVNIHISEENTTYTIRVKDSGAGIPKEDLPQIFDRFYQVQNNSFKVSQGTGIGLALTKELTILLNGTIAVKSSAAAGTTFLVTLPISRNAPLDSIEVVQKTLPNQGIQVPKKDSPNTQKDAPKVLVVEDNKDMSRYIVSCIQDSYQVSTAFNGSKGFDIALKETPDIIISDVMMPVMDGFEMTLKLQQEEATNHIPIILLTSKALQEDKLEGLESGADAYLTKPFQKAELRLRIEKLISKRKMLQKRYHVGTVFLEKKNTKEPIEDKNILFLNKVILVIEANLENIDLNSEMLARELGLSDSQLYRKLKAIANTSTAIFIRNVRLEKAKELLKSTTKTVSEIAYETGFNDPNWFGKVFKETYGTSPSKYRE